MLECVINVSEGRNTGLLDAFSAAAGPCLLDRHVDADHHRSVFTLGDEDVVDIALELARAVVRRGDLRGHAGVHPRLGLLDVVPFAPLGVALNDAIDLSEAIEARARFASLAAAELALPCFLYGPERSLPEIRRRAFVDLLPDFGPSAPNPRLGACCVGARPPLVAYNLVLTARDLTLAEEIARRLRSDSVRALSLALGGRAEVSCNLIAPWRFGPMECYDAVGAIAEIESAELVGLLPAELLARIPPARYHQLDLAAERTIEARLARIERG